MARSNRSRLPLTTIANRRIAVATVLLLLLSARAHGTPMRGVDLAQAAPPTQLRAPAVEGAGAGDTEQVYPLPNPATDGEVSLGGILAFADQRSPLLAVARSRRSLADASRVAASVLLPTNPELSFSAGQRFGRSGSSVEVDLSLMQEVEIGGERAARIEAAEALSDLTEAELEQMRWTVHCDVHAAFHGSLIEQERAMLAARVVTFQREVLRVVERQISAGEAAPLALRLAQAEVAQAEQVSVAANQAFLASRIRLAQLSGWPTATPPTPAGEVDLPRDPPPLQALRVTAGERLPHLRSAAARVREANARATVADREAWSRPSVGVSYRREGNPTTEGAYDIVMGIVSVPIPSFQLHRGERAKARAEVTVAGAELDAAQQLLDGQIADARGEVVAAAARARAYGAEILPRFEENLTLLRRSFEIGEIDILALSVGRERFLRIQSDALGAQQDYFVALAGLERVVGVDLWHDDHDKEIRP